MIPIKQAQAFAIANDLQQVIIFGHDGKETHVATWGDTVERSAQAAAGANHIKKKWGWPDDMIAESAKVMDLKLQLQRATAERDVALERVKELELLFYHSPRPAPTVHVIEGTEHERGWGQRPDGFVAFLSKEAADAWIKDHDSRVNNKSSAPDEYTVYTYTGIMACSKEFFDEVFRRKCKHFQRKQELGA